MKLLKAVLISFVIALASLTPAQILSGIAGSFEILTTDKEVGVATVIMNSSVSLPGRPVMAAVPKGLGAFFAPCGLKGATLDLSFQVIAEKLKLLEIKRPKGMDRAAPWVRRWRPDIRVRYSLGGLYYEATWSDVRGWEIPIPLEGMDPRLLVVTCDVEYKAGREYRKLFGFTIAAADSKNRAMAANTLVAARYDGDATPDALLAWQEFMGGIAAPLFTPAAEADEEEKGVKPQGQTLPLKEVVASITPAVKPLVPAPVAIKKPVAPYRAVLDGEGVKITAVTSVTVVIRYGSLPAKEWKLEAGQSIHASFDPSLEVSIRTGGKETKVYGDEKLVPGGVS